MFKGALLHMISQRIIHAECCWGPVTTVNSLGGALHQKSWREVFVMSSPRLPACQGYKNIPEHDIQQSDGFLYWHTIPRAFKASTYSPKGVKGSVCQDWLADWAPAYLHKSPHGGVVSIPLPIKLLSLTSPSRHLHSNQNGGCVQTPALSNRTSSNWLELQSL